MGEQAPVGEVWDAIGAAAGLPISSRHLRVFLALARLTWGYQLRPSDRIGSIQLGNVTGIDPSTVRRILRDLEAWQMLRRRDRGPGRRPVCELERDVDQWACPHSKRVPVDPGHRRPVSPESKRVTVDPPGGSPSTRLTGHRRPDSTQVLRKSSTQEGPPPPLLRDPETPEEGAAPAVDAETASSDRPSAPPRSLRRSRDHERAERLRVMAGLLRSHGQHPSEATVYARARATQHVPLDLLQPACDRAAVTRANERGFPPSSAAVIQAALEISAAWNMHSGSGARPDWYRRSIGEPPRARAAGGAA